MKIGKRQSGLTLLELLVAFMVLSAVVSALLLLVGFSIPELFLIPAHTDSELPRVEANDNRRPAGSLRGGVHEISLEVLRADFRVIRRW